ncbi:MAG: Type II secretion system protein H [uncultured Thiotrichaceae bacterium]|uniref:Type II secretion system protein H n=1 Tax=uncultured Thiotrichaceae bacterium TaxID=298394 RepID=A0A6S6SRJ6_9GAMM|nr:MAG: Type II secretion system protein H [uncultured Thiotrichaceae bacterium]
MMISAVGCLNNIRTYPVSLGAMRSGRGYTLLELLIVIVIIAVLSSVATMSLTGLGGDPAEKAMKQLRFDIELLGNEAIIRSEPLALGFYDQGYAFFNRPEDEDGNISEAWELITEDRLLKLQKFDDAFDHQIFARGEPLLLSGEDSLEPQIYAMPTGEITPFEYQLTDTSTDNVWDAKFDALGRFIEPDEANDSADKAL